MLVTGDAKRKAEGPCSQSAHSLVRVQHAEADSVRLTGAIMGREHRRSQVGGRSPGEFRTASQGLLALRLERGVIK